MALVVEDGTGLSNANTYVDVTYADTYFSTRGITAWASLTNKEALLIQATDYLEAVYSESWKGEKLLDTQSLSFPRVIDGVTVFPERLKYAQCELALKANSDVLLKDVGEKVIKEKVDVIEVQYAEYSDQKTQYTYVYNLLSPYLQNGSQTSRKVVRA